MKIAVLNGSPKGAKSVTLQYVHFIRKKHPEHELEIHNVAQRIGRIERDETAFDEIIDAVRAADAVLWAFPLYYCLVCSQYKRFIELIFERGVQEAFAGKHTAALSTSIHFSDHTAHNYVHAICDDLGMHFVGRYSAEMRDLFEAEERERLSVFAADFLRTAESGTPGARVYPPLPTGAFVYEPGPPAERVALAGSRALVLTDQREDEVSLARLVDRLAETFSGECEVVNLHEVNMKGGCLGCCKCGLDNVCSYEGTDDYVEFFETKVKPADLLVFAGAVHDRFLSSTWKRFFDRSFYNGHAPALKGKQLAWLIAGPLGHLPNLRETLQVCAEVQHANLVDFVSDDCADSALIDARLQALARRAADFAVCGYVAPPTFFGVAGGKLLRDEVWGPLRFVFQADHRRFRELGFFDFPQRHWKTRLMNALVIPLTRISRVRKELRKGMVDGMIRGFPKVVEEA